MNICIESQLLNHPRRSGVMTYTEGLVNGMNVVDHENNYSLVYYSLTRQSGSMPGPDEKRFSKAVIRIPDRPFWKRQFFIDNVLLPAYFKRNKTDIFHRPSGYTIPKVKNVYKILTVHDLRTLTINDNVWAQNIDQYRSVFSKIDVCVVVSQCTKQDLIKHFQVPEKKIKVIYLAADERYRRASQEKIDAIKSKLKLDQPFFLSVGSVPRKNIEGILKGFAQCRNNQDYKLVLNCMFDVDKYRQLAAALGIKDRVVFISAVSDDDLVALYSACHCFAFPSLYEGFGLPIVEAMRCGAPVITSNTSACPEVAGDAALLVDPNNIDEIANAMEQICSSTSLRKALIEKGYRRADLFSWNKFAGEMKKIYAAA